MSRTFFSKIVGITTGLASLIPVVAFAQGEIVLQEGPLRALFNQVIAVFNFVLPFLFALIIILLIVWSFQFAVSAGDEEKRKVARDRIVWGLVGLVLFSAMYGIARIVARLAPSAGTDLPEVTEIRPIVQ